MDLWPKLSCSLFDGCFFVLVSNQHSASMSVLDLFTHDGDRLTFLCNTHTLIEGRRKRIKLGFLAQLIEYVKYLFMLSNKNISFYLISI